jgi:hypothetical protein
VPPRFGSPFGNIESIGNRRLTSLSSPIEVLGKATVVVCGNGDISVGDNTAGDTGLDGGDMKLLGTICFPLLFLPLLWKNRFPHPNPCPCFG